MTYSGDTATPVDRVVICRVDSEGRDVTDMPGLNPFLLCSKCSNGEYRSKPTASWMNRWKCDKCGHCCSK